MLKFAAFAAIATASVIAAAPASAASADSVRIQVAGKTAAQVNAEIVSAAEQVCQGEFNCYGEALRQAHKQLARLTSQGGRPEEMRLTLLAGGVYAMRVSLVGKSADQLNADIGRAASAVCRPTTSGFDYATCVHTAARTAQDELRARSGQKVASN